MKVSESLRKPSFMQDLCWFLKCSSLGCQSGVLHVHSLLDVIISQLSESAGMIWGPCSLTSIPPWVGDGPKRQMFLNEGSSSRVSNSCAASHSSKFRMTFALLRESWMEFSESLCVQRKLAVVRVSSMAACPASKTPLGGHRAAPERFAQAPV